METIDQNEDNALRMLLGQLLETNRAELESRCLQVLRETLFINRASMRPNILKGIASEEVDAFFNFLSQPAYSSKEHGSHLYQIGLGERVVLYLGQILPLFFLPHLTTAQIAPMLQIVAGYQAEVIWGFVEDLKKGIYSEQEIAHKAIGHTSGD